MTDQAIAPAGDGAPAPVSTPAEAPTPSDIGRMLAQLRRQPAAESAEPAPEPDNEIPAQAEIAAPVEEPAPGETPEAIEPAAEPPIEPPRSWTKEAKERWQSLPRDTQEYLAGREQEREREFRRSQNEAAEQRKVFETERQQAEQARQQYEAKLPALMEALQRQSQFSDIRTLDDVKKLQAEDPFRFQAWQVHQMDMQAVNAELSAAEQRKQQEHQTNWTTSVQKENALAEELIPELADKVRGPALKQRAAERLTELGFSPEELNALASGKERLSIFDHRLQRLIFSDLRLAEIQGAKTAVAAKPVPPVQRPGAAKPPGAAARETIQNLSAKLERTGKTSDLANLIGGMRKAGA